MTLFPPPGRPGQFGRPGRSSNPGRPPAPGRLPGPGRPPVPGRSTLPGSVTGRSSPRKSPTSPGDGRLPPPGRFPPAPGRLPPPGRGIDGRSFPPRSGKLGRLGGPPPPGGRKSGRCPPGRVLPGSVVGRFGRFGREGGVGDGRSPLLGRLKSGREGSSGRLTAGRLTEGRFDGKLGGRLVEGRLNDGAEGRPNVGALPGRPVGLEGRLKLGRRPPPRPLKPLRPNASCVNKQAAMQTANTWMRRFMASSLPRCSQLRCRCSRRRRTRGRP